MSAWPTGYAICELLGAAGDLLPSIYKTEFTGDRGDLSAGFAYANGRWTVEIGGELVTGSELDVQFDDMAPSADDNFLIVVSFVFNGLIVRYAWTWV